MIADRSFPLFLCLSAVICSHHTESSIVKECHTDCVARNGVYDNLYGTIIR